MSHDRPAARDAGLDLIRRVNRWLIAGAVVCTGGVSVAAARAFHGRTVTSGAGGAAKAVTPAAASSSAAQSQSAASSNANGLQSPTQAPTSAQTAPAQPAPSPVVSGGS